MAGKTGQHLKIPMQLRSTKGLVNDLYNHWIPVTVSAKREQIIFLTPLPVVQDHIPDQVYILRVRGFKVYQLTPVKL